MKKTSADSPFATALAQVRSEYQRLGHSLGWRFLCSPQRVLEQNPHLVFLTLNPGGNTIPPDHPPESCEAGSAYVVEQWGTARPGMHKLQRQVQQLFAAIGDNVSPANRAGVTLDSSLVGYFIPFRSPRFADLHSPKESIAFARGLWASLLRPLAPRLLLAIDRDTFTHMNGLCVSTGGTLVSHESMPTGWGEYTAEVSEYRFTDRSCMVVRFPHLSTFQLFGRAASAPYVNAILAKGCKYL